MRKEKERDLEKGAAGVKVCPKQGRTGPTTVQIMHSDTQKFG